jgi:hypothetical protein
MGIVTSRASGSVHGITAVGLFERSFGAIMAVEAKGRLGLDKEVLLVGTVCEVAGRATFLPHLMNDLLFKIPFFVTLKTGCVPFRLQQVVELGSVRIMALSAFPSPQGRMHIRFVHPDLFFAVAGIADFIPFFFQDQFGYETVPEMAVLAFLLFDGGMDVFHPHILLSKFLMAVEAPLAYKPSSSRRRPPQRPFLRRFGAGVQKDHSYEKKDSQNNGFMS